MNIKQIDVSGHKYDICDAKMRDAVADEYDVLSTYRQGDFCIYNNVVYRCLEETTGVWQETKWEKKTLAELYKEMEIMTHISDAFSESKEYAAGKYCIYENELYKFTAAKTAGAWDQQKVVATSVDAELRELNANITTVSGKIPTKYAGSASAGGSANSAVKLDNSAGSAIQPVYFSGGKPVACTHTLGKSVPANAVFTDTNTWRGIQNNLTSTATDQSLSANMGRILNDEKARIIRTTWGKSITIPNLPHGFVFLGEYALYLIWAAGNPGAYQMNKALLHGSDVLNISINASNGTVTVSLKDMTLNGGIIYIGG